MPGVGTLRPAALLELTSRVAKLVSTARGFEDAAALLIESVCETAGFRVGHLYVVDPDEEALVPSQVWHGPEDPRTRTFREQTADTPVHLGEGLVGKAAQVIQPICIRDVSADPDFARRDGAREADLKGGYAFPIIHDGELFGVAEFFDDEPAKRGLSLFNAIEACAGLVGVIADREQMRVNLVEQQVRLMLASAHEAAVVADASGCIVGMNRHAEDMFGWQTADVTTRTVMDVLLAPESVADAVDAARKVFESEWDDSGRRIETVCVTKAGDLFPVEIAMWPVSLGGRRFVYSIVRDRSILDAEEALSIAQRRLTTAMRRAGVGEWEMDLRTGRVALSEQACVLLGVDPGTVEGSEQAMMDRIHPEDRGRVLAAIERTLHTAEPTEYEHRLMCPDGSLRRVRARIETEFDAQGKATRLYGTAWDVTDHDVLQHLDGSTPDFQQKLTGVTPASERPRLTERELEILSLLRDGLDVTRIAKTLGISIHTARDHLKRIRTKLAVQSQLQAVVKAAALGLLPELS